MNDDLKKLLEENLAKNETVYQEMKKIKRYLLITQILSLVKILIIVVPIILAVIYLPPFLNDLFQNPAKILESSGLVNIPR